MNTNLTGLFLAVLSLSACSGGSGSTRFDGGNGDNEQPVETRTAGTTSGMVGGLPEEPLDARYDKRNDVLTLNLRGSDVELANDLLVAEVNGFKTYRAEGNVAIALRAATSSGGGSAMIVYSRSGDYDVQGVEFERLANSEIPVTGTATYQGQYAGIIGSPESGANFIIQGDAEIETNFNDAQVSGRISNRTLANADPGNTFILNDIVLHEGEINPDGTFIGIGVTGGQIVGDTLDPGSTTTTGSYSGAIVGPSGNEVVGGVTINHDYQNVDLIETGAFTASQ
ncbi:hypothetical protein [uncultured Ruegeria sp.]|uniref:hypothetical protein n=1 Tax=uncultured Ruegeria sp. TaxID=259304 RepID=UPI0026041C17|nr:hypothetical protein [uncultured Ruegeria sp.]